jgi:hypothetical protein
VACMQRADGLPHDAVTIIVDSTFDRRSTNSDALMAPTADPTGAPITASASGAKSRSNTFLILAVVSGAGLVFVAVVYTIFYWNSCALQAKGTKTNFDQGVSEDNQFVLGNKVDSRDSNN